MDEKMEDVKNALLEHIAEHIAKSEGLILKSDTTKSETGVRFHRELHLDETRRDVPWFLTYGVVDPDDTVLIQARYRLECKDDRGCYGNHDFHLYVVKKEKRFYCKCVNVMPLEGEAEKLCDRYFKQQVAYVEMINTGVFVPEYKKKLLANTTVFELDDGFQNVLKSMSKVKFGRMGNRFTCKYSVSLLHYDCYDFVNRNVLVADGFCLTRYKPYVDLLNYIFARSPYKYLAPSPIELVEALSIAQERMIKACEDKIKSQAEFEMWEFLNGGHE